MLLLHNVVSSDSQQKRKGEAVSCIPGNAYGTPSGCCCRSSLRGCGSWSSAIYEFYAEAQVSFFPAFFFFLSLLPIFLALFGGVPSGARKWAENCLVGGAGEYVRVGGGGGVCVRSWGIKAVGVQTVLKWRWGSVGRKMVVRVFFS